ncbi:MAG: sigma-54 interaction domain-containing protein [Gammaproteobacteria bacterium]
MDYVLVTDDCADCHYISNAFTLFNLPLKQVTLDNLDAAQLENSLSTFVCAKLEASHQQMIETLFSKLDTYLISWNSNIKYQPNIKVLSLGMPFSKSELLTVLGHCVNRQKDILDLNNPIFEKLVGASEQIRKIKTLIWQVAQSDSTVLILGESGVGKDVITKCIHQLSERKNQPLVPINCGAIPAELIESELFGHEKGAFTGAISRRPGRFEMAHKGTLFLDEIGDMPLPMQVKLLRVLQERKIERVGSTTPVDVDVRLVAATNKNLDELIKQNHFRSDLYYRINVFPIYVPSLRERSEDIPAFIDYQLNKIADRLKHRVEFTDQALSRLSEYAWPGNIRELQNFLERMVILYPDCVIDEDKLDQAYKIPKDTTTAKSIELNASFNIKEYIANIEKEIIETALAKTNGIINEAASYLSMGRTTLLEKIKKYNLSLST